MLDIVIFGGVGDLSLRKLLPSLYYLFRDKQLPDDARILCVSRSELSRIDFLDKVEGKLNEFLGVDFEKNTWEKFEKILSYQSVDLSKSEEWNELVSFIKPSGSNDKNIVYYLSVTPSLFAPICENLKTNNLNPPNARVVVEKPLGEDLKSAIDINKIIANSFNENQIYRIDHYLGKEAVQNILHLRFSNHLMETVWSNNHIDRVDITVSETVGVEGRARFLDRIGTLRDMVQNHLMQLLSYVAMEPPESLKANDIRDQKVEVIKALRPIDNANVGDTTIRAQYIEGEIHGKKVPGYQQEIKDQPYEVEGTGETFIALKVNIDNDRWSGVPFYLKTGKRLKSRYAEIRITFKPPTKDLYDEMDSNQLTIQIQPELTVSINLLMKQLLGSDSQLIGHSNQMDLNGNAGADVRVPEAYERLLREVIKGNQTYFVRDDEILASWGWIDGIRNAWQETDQEMQRYTAGSEGPTLN